MGVRTWLEQFLFFVAGGGKTQDSMIGQIDGKILIEQPWLDDPRIGKSAAFPVPERIVVSATAEGAMAYIGKTAHAALFPTYPEFAFNVAFACNASDDGQSDYANPASIWSNVFFGYYELDAPVRLWNRPFGYYSDDPHATINVEDLARVGKADWNYFSNHMYGVPKGAITPYDNIDMDQVKFTNLGRENIEGRYWDHVRLSGVTVVSGGCSTQDNGKLVGVDEPWTALWQKTFGTYPQVPTLPASFPGVPMSAEIYMCFVREYDLEYKADVFKTYMFGGTINDNYPDAAENARFLQLQMDSLRKIIADMKDVGFTKK
jgi:hypothetical protein